MSVSGRGRGRGRGLLARESMDEASSRPGGGDGPSKVVENGTESSRKESVTAAVSIEELEEVLNQMNLSCTDAELENIYHMAENTIASGHKIEKLAETVYDKCVSDREFAKTGAYICDKLANLEASGTKFRSSLLSLVQKDFKDKEELRHKSISKFLNVFSFLCQVFGTMRTANGEVFKPLVGPVLEFLNLILDSKQADNDEYECLNEQLHAIGRDLEQNDKEGMETLIGKIRNRIIRTGSSAPVRCALLEVMECYCRGWRDLSNDVTRFYCDTMMDIITD